MDAEGNVFSNTISDPQTGTPMVPGWGFGLGGRGGQFNLNPDLANVVAAGKRPRNTNSPFLVMKDGHPFMGLSTPGADEQVQSLLQVLLNVIEWQMPIEHAVDQPRFGSSNFPGTGSEVNRSPGVLIREQNLGGCGEGLGGARTRDALLGRLELSHRLTDGDVPRPADRPACCGG